MTNIPDAAVQAAANYIALGIDNGSTPRAIAENALNAALPQLPLYFEVKQLEWEFLSGDYYAQGCGTQYNVYETNPNRWNAVTTSPKNIRLVTNGTLEEAKAAAQADFERRVRECITLNPIKLTDGEINDITYDKLGKWPSFEAQSWACKVVHTVLSQIAINSVDMTAVRDDGLIKELEDAAAWRRLPDHESHHATALLFERAVERIRSLSAEPAQGEQDEPCGVCGEPDCDFDCDGEYDAPTTEVEREALEKVIKAWENTKAGTTTVKEIQRWLIEDMKPAIDAGRAALAQGGGN